MAAAAARHLLGCGTRHRLSECHELIGSVEPDAVGLDGLEVVTDDVDAVGSSAAGQTGVGGLAVRPIVDEQE